MKLLCFLWLTVAVGATPCMDNQHCATCTIDSLCTSQCYNGYYGVKCNHKCRTGCRFNICRSENGIGRCTFGCKLGFYGTRCNIPCETSNTCKKCTHECEGGFCQLESSCAQGCEDSYYGDTCKSCPAGCKVCNRVSGTCEVCLHCEGDCTHGCLEGCDAGYFGDFCEHTCSTGCLFRCNQVSGECFKCKLGLSGGTCKNQCSKGCLGDECELDGTCANGCREGSYGQKCDSICSRGCLKGNCNLFGVCTLGCTQGWYGPMCEYKCGKGCEGEICDSDGKCSNKCKVNFYGEQCLSKCPAFCLNKVCEAEDGSCMSCEKGFYGSHCDKTCHKCVDDACTKKTGHCTQGCLSNHRGEFCQHDCEGDCDGEECREVCKNEYGKGTPSEGVLTTKYILYPVAAVVVVIVSALVTYAACRYKRRQSVNNGRRTEGQGNQLQPQRNNREDATEPTVSFYCEMDNDPMRSPQLPRRFETQVLLNEVSTSHQTSPLNQHEDTSKIPKPNSRELVSSNNSENNDNTTFHIKEGTSDSPKSVSPSLAEPNNDASAHIQDADIQSVGINAVLNLPSRPNSYLKPFGSNVEGYVNKVVKVDDFTVHAEASGSDAHPQGEVKVGTSTRSLRDYLPVTSVYDQASEFDAGSSKDTSESQNDCDAVKHVRIKTADGDGELTTIPVFTTIADCYDNFSMDAEEEAIPNPPPDNYSKLFTTNYVRK